MILLGKLPPRSYHDPPFDRREIMGMMGEAVPNGSRMGVVVVVVDGDH